MTLVFSTKTGSRYEVDLGAKRARRVSGEAADHRLADGEWRYWDVFSLTPSRAWFVWSGKGMCARTLLTSPVEGVEVEVTNDRSC